MRAVVVVVIVVVVVVGPLGKDLSPGEGSRRLFDRPTQSFNCVHASQPTETPL